MKYQSQQIGPKMSLDEALNTFSGDISYLTLKDGTNIEIVQNSRHEMGYIDNQLNLNDNDEFVEENLDENFNDYNYQQIFQNQPLALRGRDKKKKMGKKSLRKTVLKSLKGNEKEKNIPTEGKKLRNLKEKLIFQQTDNNEFLQCANCLKFFVLEEDKTENEKTNDNSKPQTPNNQKIPSQPQNNYQFIPKNQQKPHPSQQIRPNQKIPQNYPKQPQQQYYQQILPQHPQQKKSGQNMHQKVNVNVNQGNLRNNQMPMKPMAQQFRGQNQAFRAREKVTNRYESNNERYFNQNNMINNNNYTGNYYYYPASGKKIKNKDMLCDECSPKKKMTKNISYGNLNVERNLNFGFNTNQEIGYTNNNVSEFLNVNEEYYQYPPDYQRGNINETGYGNVNNHKVVTIKTYRNQYPEYEYY